MNTRLVTISRQLGTGSEDVARLVAGKLGFRYLDRQVIEAAATEAGVSPETLIEAEHLPSLTQRLMETLVANRVVLAGGWIDPTPLGDSPLYISQDYRRFLEGVIKEVAKEGEAVILGHGAAHILPPRWDTVKVAVTGSRECRARRVMQRTGADEKAALKEICEYDEERIQFFRRFYHTEWLSPANYDLAINTDHISLETAAGLVVLAACQRC